jgi:hypothetical protein
MFQKGDQRTDMGLKALRSREVIEGRKESVRKRHFDAESIQAIVMGCAGTKNPECFGCILQNLGSIAWM